MLRGQAGMQGISVRWVQRKRRLAADLGVQVPPRAKMSEARFIELGGRGFRWYGPDGAFGGRPALATIHQHFNVGS
jgi:hypothetical protein